MDLAGNEAKEVEGAWENKNAAVETKFMKEENQKDENEESHKDVKEEIQKEDKEVEPVEGNTAAGGTPVQSPKAQGFHQGVGYSD